MKRNIQFLTTSKRRLSVFLMLLKITIVSYGQTFTKNDIKYEVITNSVTEEVKIIEYEGSGGDLVIPEAVENNGTNYTVTNMNQQVFVNKQITSVELPETLVAISTSAFWGNQFTNVTIPRSVTSIDKNAFGRNFNLTKVIMKSNVPPSFHLQAFNGGGHTQAQMDLIVPKGAKNDYKGHSFWSQFQSISEIVEIGDTFTVNNIEYKITSQTEAEVMVMSYTGSGGDLSIPEVVEYNNTSYTITVIGNRAFSKNIDDIDKLTSVTIPSGVRVIEQYAFSYNDLTSVNFSDDSQLETIQLRAFQYNNFETIELPESLKEIGPQALAYGELTSVKIPEGVEIIADATFKENKITSIALPNSLITIEANAFSTNQLSRVTIPESVTQIGTWAFAGNPRLNTIVVKGDSPPTVGQNIFTLVFPQYVPPKPNDERKGKIDLLVPEGAELAYKDWNGTAFFKSIRAEFFNVDDLKYQITALGVNKRVIVVDYTNNTTNTSVDIPETVNKNDTDYIITAIGENALRGKEMTNIALPSTLTCIGKNALANNQLSSIIIPENVTHIGKGALCHNNLTVVTIPGRVTTIGAEVFKANSGLSVVQITPPINSPSSIVPLFIEDGDKDPFKNANRNQIDLIVPSGTTSDYESSGWTGFKSTTEGLNVGDTVDVNDFKYTIESLNPYEVGISDYMGTNTDITIDETMKIDGKVDYSIVAIKESAFASKNLASVTIPSTVTSIVGHAFKNNQLERVTIPNSVESIGDAAFSTNKLEEVTLPGTVNITGSFLFATNNLKRATVSEGIVTIRHGLFADNDLEDVELPSSLVIIEQNAFNQNKLKSITIPANVTHIGIWSFGANNDLVTVEVEATTPPGFTGDSQHIFTTIDEDKDTSLYRLEDGSCCRCGNI